MPLKGFTARYFRFKKAFNSWDKKNSICELSEKTIRQSLIYTPNSADSPDFIVAPDVANRKYLEDFASKSFTFFFKRL